MNKHIQALNLIDSYLPKDDRNVRDAVILLREQCDKETLLKPNYEKDEIGDRGAFGGTGYMTFTNAICPCCGEYLDEDKKDSRCQECGQLIDWTEDDDFYDEDEGDYD